MSEDGHGQYRYVELGEPVPSAEKVQRNENYGVGENVPPRAKSVLEKAESLINGDRRREYGHPLENFTRVAAYWTAYLSNLSGGPRGLSPEDVAHMMILLKVARGAQGYSDDTYVDIAGYAGCVEAINDAREEARQAVAYEHVKGGPDV